MTRCLDIHTHHPAPQPLGVISTSVTEGVPSEEQLYSLGIHPWFSDISPSLELQEEFQKLASSPQVVAIGECGIDKIKGSLLFKQMLFFKYQIEVSESLQKPLIIHDVKAHDIIVEIKKELKPKQKWVIHGFRGKPSLAKMFTDNGIFLSFGEKFNPDTPRTVPPELILAETDESPLTIEEIITNLSQNLGRDLMGLIEQNTNHFLFDS